jgi:hypothetical protein
MVPPNTSPKKIYLTLAFLAFLAVLGGITLDGVIRLALWIFLAGLAVKTWLLILRKP